MSENSFMVKRIAYSSLLLSVALIAALYFNGAQRYLLSLCWLSLMIWGVYQLSLHKTLKISIDITTVVLLGFVLWMLIALYWHPTLYRGIYYNWRIGIFFYVLLVTVYLIQERDIKATFNSILVVGFVIGLLSLYQSLVVDTEAAGLFINKNNNAAFLNLFVLPLMSLLLFNGEGKGRVFKSTAFVFLLLAVLQVASRGALIGLGMASLLLVVFAAKMRKKRGLILVGTLVVLTFLLDSQFSIVELRTDLQSNSRWYLLSSTIQMIWDGSWHGAGNGMWRYIYPVYRSVEDLSAASFVHNDYLQLLYELGIPAFILLFLFAVTFIHKVYLLIKREQDAHNLALFIGLFAAIMAVAIHSVVTFNFYKTGILLVLGFYTGLIIRQAQQLQLNGTYSFSVTVTGKKLILLLVLMIIPFQSIVLPGYANAVSRGLIEPELYDRSPLEKYQIYTELRSFDPASFRYPLKAANVLALSGKDKPLEERREIFRQCRGLYRESKRLNPYATGVYIAEAELLSKYRDVVGELWYQEAVSLANKALTLNPGVFSNRLYLAKLLAEEVGDKEKALNVLLQSYDHPHNLIRSYHEYGRDLASELGNHYAEERFSQMLEKFPDIQRH